MDGPRVITRVLKGRRPEKSERKGNVSIEVETQRQDVMLLALKLEEGAGSQRM